ncbi:MAG: hypothetical protein JW894_16400 [Bacteroidales bacterium]|nr:hypothetical protein [Bacteroidales bacterium]
MKRILIISLLAYCILFFPTCSEKDQRDNSRYIISKKNGEIILAYQAFIDFLKTDKSWDNYNKLLLKPYPEVQLVHNRQLGWGAIDSINFPNSLKDYKIEDYEHFLTQYDTNTLNYLYDSVILKAHTILPPISNKQVDLCFFLPYGSCFVVPEEEKNTIYISMWINPDDVEKIMAHEYGHILHFDRRPEEPLTLMREVIAEGMAVYLTNLIVDDLEVTNSVPFMPEESFKWCMDNEEMIKDSIYHDLNDTTMQLFTKYISDGSFAKPPEGFVQKTAYFAGYRIIEECIKKGMELEEICKMGSEEIIAKSGYFN